MKEINPYLKQVEKYLVDLPILDRNKIISELNSEIQENRQILEKSPLLTANEKRIKAGFENYETETAGKSIGKAFFKGCAFVFVCFLLFVVFLTWKFTPLFKIDEKNQRVTILGGLIDIDGKAGRFILIDEVHFTAANYSNDLTGSIVTNRENLPVYLNFESGKFDFKTHVESEVSFECKLSSPPTDDMIKQERNKILINFEDLEGSNCTIKLPEDSKLIASGNIGAVNFEAPKFDIELELDAGNIIITPDQTRTYFYDLSVDKGHKDEFDNSNKESAEHKIIINLNTGSISK